MKKILTLIALTVFFFSSAYAQRMYDSNGRQIGRVDSERYYDGSGRQIGRVDGSSIYDGSGRQLGRIDGDRVYNSSGSQIGRIDGERLYSGSGSQMVSDVSVCETNRGTWLKEGFGSSFNLRSEDEIEI